MSTKTTNYEFVKPALSDAPPDITATNGNWDLVDEKLKTAEDHASSTQPVSKGGTGATTASQARTNLGAVSKTGDTMTGDLTVDNKTVNVTTKDGDYVKGTATIKASHASSTFLGSTKIEGRAKFGFKDTSGNDYHIDIGNQKASTADTVYETWFNYVCPKGTYPIHHDGRPMYEIGTYTGDGTSSRNISLNFGDDVVPSAILVMSSTGLMHDTRNAIIYGGLATKSTAVSVGNNTVVSIAQNGTLSVSYKTTTIGSTEFTIASNKAGQEYVYIAFR